MTKAAVPVHQRLLVGGARVISAALVIGAGLDVISNAKSLISPWVTYIGTGVLLIGCATVPFILRTHPLTWVAKDGTRTRINRLGFSHFIAAVALIVVLWIPRIADVLRPPDRADIEWARMLMTGQQMKVQIVKELPEHMRQSRLVEGALYTIWYQQEPCIWRSYGPRQFPKDVNGGALVPHHFDKSGTSITNPHETLTESASVTSECNSPLERKVVILGIPADLDRRGYVSFGGGKGPEYEIGAIQPPSRWRWFRW